MPNEDQYEEKGLLFRIAEGDEAAFEQLFFHHLPMSRRVVYGIVKQEAVVNDIIQEVFLNVWLNRTELTQINSFSHWIYKLLYHRSLNWLRKQSYQKKDGQLYFEKGLTSLTSNETEEAVIFAETSRLVKEAIMQLPAQTRKVYMLSRENGFKVPEIAEQLNLSQQTVKNILVRAGKNIREYLIQHDIKLPLILFVFTAQNIFLHQ